ncbi:oxidoreductase, NAD-binding Rossmann fold family protein [Mycobacteroides abscessus MAB_030201_1061]|nr:oxidoreductase, NAD-binding Rossmann fold family protein [Mycobacteroides abscessus MAB_030201_1061]
MLKVGIIGAGGVARAHARALNTLKSAELVGVLDIDARAAESFTDAYGGTPVTDVDALLELADAVVVASPNFTHRDHSLSALRAGRSVLCEKPLALSRVEAKEMVAAAGEIASPHSWDSTTAICPWSLSCAADCSTATSARSALWNLGFGRTPHTGARTTHGAIADVPTAPAARWVISACTCLTC